MNNVKDILDLEEIAFISTLQNETLVRDSFKDCIDKDEDIRFNHYINDVAYDFLIK